MLLLLLLLSNLRLLPLLLKLLSSLPLLLLLPLVLLLMINLPCSPCSAARMVGDGVRNGYCMRSCGACDSSGDIIATCADFTDDCAWWSKNGYCGTNEYVKVYCAASCGTCETVVIDDTAGERWSMAGLQAECWECFVLAGLPKVVNCC